MLDDPLECLHRKLLGHLQNEHLLHEHVIFTWLHRPSCYIPKELSAVESRKVGDSENSELKLRRLTGEEGRGGETTFVSSYREVRKNGGYHDTFENRHIFYGSIVVFMTKKPSFFFQMLCERLLKMYQQSVMIAEGEACDKQQRKQATAIALRLKAPSEIDLEEYYPAFLDMIRNLLDGKLE